MECTRNVNRPQNICYCVSGLALDRRSALLFSIDFLCLWLQSVQYDLQHDFARMADEADRSVVLALLQVAFLRKCDDQGLGPRGWPFSCLSDLVAESQECGDYCFSTCLD